MTKKSDVVSSKSLDIPDKQNLDKMSKKCPKNCPKTVQSPCENRCQHFVWHCLPIWLVSENKGDVSPEEHLVAHDCGYPLSRYTCRATRVAADCLDFIAFCRCSTGVALHPLQILVSHLSVAGVALHCVTKEEQLTFPHPKYEPNRTKSRPPCFSQALATEENHLHVLTKQRFNLCGVCGLLPCARE